LTLPERNAVSGLEKIDIHTCRNDFYGFFYTPFPDQPGNALAWGDNSGAKVRVYRGDLDGKTLHDLGFGKNVVSVLFVQCVVCKNQRQVPTPGCTKGRVAQKKRVVAVNYVGPEFVDFLVDKKGDRNPDRKVASVEILYGRHPEYVMILEVSLIRGEGGGHYHDVMPELLKVFGKRGHRTGHSAYMWKICIGKHANVHV
jgi:hypothetical protein